MKIVYVSNLCSDAVFANIMDTAQKCPAMCEQKYHRVMTQGIYLATGEAVTAVTAPPVSPVTHKRWFFCAKADRDDHVCYQYLPVVNLPGVKLIWQVIASFFACAVRCVGKEQVTVICDMLCGSAAMGARAAARFFRREFTGIITDIPDFLGDTENISFLDRLLKRQMQGCDSFVLLTEEMNKKINPNGRPYCVVEGQADSYAHNLPQEEKASPRVTMYAGAVEKIYGLDRLAQAFSQLPEAAGVLEIYGNGDYMAELKEFCKTHPNVRYMGLLPNQQIVKRERQAILLVNPRPSDAEYTKYSFPSKTMEYLASGTAVLTTRLTGIPREYDDYLLYIDDESVAGIRLSLEKALTLSDEALILKGQEGQRWVLKEKNSRMQARKILHMWECTRK